ncbi:MAG: ABC transporter ATP-binding protein [Muribaculum sp.]|nr:ABC transporter ATP-binding protein [Muribaculum sp.]
MVGGLSVRDVTKSFIRDGEEMVALNHVSIDIDAGSFVSVIGPSGCGKSTLLRLIAGLIKADQGELLLDGEPVKGPGCDRGLVFQNPTLFPWLNIYDNIAFGLKAGNRRMEKRLVREKVEENIRLVGLEGFEKSYPHQLSGGMCQRASLARSLVGKPRLLLLDEPLGALDAFTRMNMQDELLRIWEKENMTMIMVTHDVDEAVYLSDKVIVMSARPAKIEKIINIKMSRPRARSGEEFLLYRSRILKLLNYGGKDAEVSYYI